MGVKSHQLRVTLGLFFVLFLFPFQAHSDCVILLHGLARTSASMSALAQLLDQHHFDVVNLGYPSREHSIKALSKLAITPALKECRQLINSKASSGKPPKVHFVTHSMGGILVRQYFENAIPKNMGRVVMLAPPNGGSEVVDKLRGWPGFKWLNGPAGLELGTGLDSVPNTLSEPSFELGVIAGNKSINLFLSTLILGPDDGKVSIERTKLRGMKDHLVMPVVHPFIMKNKAVMEQVVLFLKTGEFRH